MTGKKEQKIAYGGCEVVNLSSNGHISKVNKRNEIFDFEETMDSKQRPFRKDQSVITPTGKRGKIMQFRMCGTTLGADVQVQLSKGRVLKFIDLDALEYPEAEPAEDDGAEAISA